MVNRSTNLYTFSWHFRIEREIQLETMKYIFISIILTLKIYGQEYSIQVLGFNICDVNQNITNSNRIDFNTQNRGLFDFFWPAKNNYSTEFDLQNHSIIKWNKTVKQGAYKISLSAFLDSGDTMIYSNDQKIKLSPPVYNLFSLIALVQSSDKDLIDARWYNYEHEGRIGKARFLWADSSNVWDGEDSILCDHYRFDILITDSSKVIKNNDYFMKYIINNNAVREIWVSRSKPKRIISSKVELPFFDFYAQIVRNKEL